MRILVLQDADWMKKGPHQQHHLMEKLSIKGFEILVICFDQLWYEEKGIFSKKCKIKKMHRFYDNAKIDYVKPFFVKVPIIDYLSFSITSRLEIKKAIDEFKPNIIIGFTSIITNYWGSYYAKKNNIPFIYYWTDVIHTLIPIKLFTPIAKSIEKRIIKNSTKVLTINEALNDLVINYGASGKTEIIPGGIDFNHFNPSLYDEDDIRKKFAISNEDRVIFFMGWLYEFSGLKEVIIELSKNRNNNIKLIIVGYGEYYDELKKLILKERISDKVIMTGKIPFNEIPSFIYAADICILPAYHNNVMKDIVPIKMYEYLAMYKPVISTKLPGVMMEFGKDNGVIYVDHAREVINKVLSIDEEELKVHKNRAKTFIEKYDWNEIIIQFEKILDELI